MRGGERGGAEAPAALRALPAIGRLVEALLREEPGLPRAAATRAAREEVAALRARLLSSPERPAPAFGDVLASTRARARRLSRPGLARVINATGVAIHTNLGRAPLAPEAVAAVSEVARGYCDLEIDLETGSRGRRGATLHERLAALTGAEAGLAVNNNAAAVFLALRALAAGREVAVSRGELIEIGGSFRLPEIFEASGARLREVGTTNRTRIEDYARALDAGASVLLKVHRSNFRQVGFTEEASLPELSALARARGVPLIYDLGGGLLEPVQRPPPGWDEPTVREAVARGADLVCFSGDKLFGGPQAGLVVGRGDRVAALARDPVYRMVRIDKMTAAALVATLALHEAGETGRLPVHAACFADPAELRRRAAALARSIRRSLAGRPSPPLAVVQAAGRVGGGAAPELDLPGWALRIQASGGRAHRILAALRAGDPPVIARADDGAIWVDPRTVLPGEEAALADALARAIAACDGADNCSE